MLTSYQLDSPELSWGEDGAPHSNLFDDVYFDKESGLEETRHVFLKNNQLSERWASLQKKTFVIAETGFGTGLNFLCAWQAFLTQAASDKQLHFISVEKYPLSKSMLTAALNMWPSLNHYSQPLIDAYPEVCHGFHHLELAQGRIQLSLWFGDAEDGFAALDADVDAWFLDGFAPSKNPQMWSDTLFKHIHRLSHQGTTFSTFTAAGIVRRGLKSVGFEVRKVKGFGQKREMTVGELNQPTPPLTERMSQGQSWFNLRSDSTAEVTKVLVVGAGLAGANTAYALAKQGIRVEVWEQGSVIAGGASGNPQGMLYPKLTTQDSFLNRFYLAAYLHATRFYSALDKQRTFWDPCGLIQLPKHDKEAERFQKLLQQQLYPKSVLQASTQKPGSLLLPLSGWVIPKKLCETLLSHPNIQLRLNTALKELQSTTLQPEDKTAIRWRAIAANHSDTFSHVVLCTANDTNELSNLPHLPIYPIRGQVAQMNIEDAVNACLQKGESAEKIDIEQVLCEFGYVSPPIDGLIHFGSTYDLKDQDTAVREEGHKRNLTILEDLLGLKGNTFKTEDCQGRVAFRCAVTDYTPIVGPIQSTEVYQQAYSTLSKNAKWRSDNIAELNQQLYVNIGHGSRGLISTPLSGRYIASLIAGTPSPLEQNVSHTLHPSRFIIRDLKRSQKV
ncbi:bifunctional tRNA (5-methylaminomethyl-2-thiouridine)(34)-methyltransferase MnmD/FAD-dependent 5-carboxymethylaminomethyl-2-thiouridine(34) oxidoreductase MnmC [Marinomonas sp. M1K-6]|uniref:tRNA 5-methylaminomethyl-2-thiouridine biosynthesis bifunctional protein MnmC n=1 Tax=Marinomonas profundi TaxID=2726122 RepID=A0A847QWM5_9GAMM|nr:bifunctional tRNA (5-methylaminomethyl-2-thiouridine)(34)-methyltransferase MnmD/FAD-dependent 5-carboxymethylaminomethyl-2-thiouridine(34) oxidoreductase MnmC [Marinomonas profundi]NLQ16579.1 bifunctional tRNA (5-methylaminomethyl-2-thiouridine)(34)-methyltransferase MnmD/FAD-dependent 5-carboxymethylaminomethyl-2-thiouridine(34) oxidoreductase MnmC [Marinomonas profundi]UDV03836.1 bifunctional tRNA (5-methylaminomethyl-2-thiouridine)(34)-methyltransferase MnmD/FAD-dependent 5-carboxymethylam